MLGLKREIDQIAKDKGIDKRVIIGALEEAMKQAARRKYGQEKEIEARFNEELGEIELFEFRTVVENLTDPENQILLAPARALDPEAEEGDQIGVKLDTSLPSTATVAIPAAKARSRPRKRRRPARGRRVSIWTSSPRDASKSFSRANRRSNPGEETSSR